MYLPLNEQTYFGKNMSLIKAEKLISNMKESFTAMGRGSYNINEKTYRENSDELEKILAKLFGFKNVYINKSFIGSYIKAVNIPNGGKIGAFTLCHSSAFTMNEAFADNIDKLHNGIKFKPNANVNCIIMLDNTLFASNDVPELEFTPPEILAIILHEVGHNFYSDRGRMVLSQLFLTLLNPSYLMAWLSNEIINIPMMKLDVEGGDKVFHTPRDFIRKAFARWDSSPIGRVVSDSITTISNLTPLKLLLFPMMILLQAAAIAPVINAYAKYDSEKYSDSFAAAYGYGADIATALIKMEDVYTSGAFAKMRFSDNTHVRNLGNFLRDVDYAIMLPFTTLSQAVIPHPKTYARLMNNIKYLEDCSEYIDNPRLRAEYKADVARLNKLKDSIVKKGENGGFKDKFLASDIETMGKRSWADIKDWSSAMVGKDNDILRRV